MTKNVIFALSSNYLFKFLAGNNKEEKCCQNWDLASNTKNIETPKHQNHQKHQHIEIQLDKTK